VRLIDDGCGPDDEDGADTGDHRGLACAPLAAATEAFDSAASDAFSGGRISTNGTAAQLRELAGIVAGIVDGCGFQVLFDVASSYPEPIRSHLLDTAAVALGDLYIEPDGLRCADLQALGYSAKDAVDYWFLWGSPPLMDADLNGVPCETVFPDVAEYLPGYY
jgi:hypothetical protein